MLQLLGSRPGIWTFSVCGTGGLAELSSVIRLLLRKTRQAVLSKDAFSTLLPSATLVRFAFSHFVVSWNRQAGRQGPASVRARLCGVINYRPVRSWPRTGRPIVRPRRRQAPKKALFIVVPWKIFQQPAGRAKGGLGWWPWAGWGPGLANGSPTAGRGGSAVTAV